MSKDMLFVITVTGLTLFTALTIVYVPVVLVLTISLLLGSIPWLIYFGI